MLLPSLCEQWCCYYRKHCMHRHSLHWTHFLFKVTCCEVKGSQSADLQVAAASWTRKHPSHFWNTLETEQNHSNWAVDLGIFIFFPLWSDARWGRSTAGSHRNKLLARKYERRRHSGENFLWCRRLPSPAASLTASSPTLCRPTELLSLRECLQYLHFRQLKGKHTEILVLAVFYGETWL